MWHYTFIIKQKEVGGNVVPFNNRVSSHHPGMVYIRDSLEDTERSFFMFSSEHHDLPQGPPEPLSGAYNYNYDLIVLNTFI